MRSPLKTAIISSFADLSIIFTRIKEKKKYRKILVLRRQTEAIESGFKHMSKNPNSEGFSFLVDL